MSTVGFGDISPQNFYERMVGQVWMICAIAYQGYAIGNVQTIIEKSDEANSDLNSKLDTLNKFHRANNLPPEIMSRITKFFTNLRD